MQRTYRRTYKWIMLVALALLLGYATGHHAFSIQFSNIPVLEAFGVRRTAEEIPAVEVVPLGMTIGVRINTDGVMVLGTGVVHGADGQVHNPSDGKLRAGDLILKINNAPILNKESLEQLVAESKGKISFWVRRGGAEMTIEITPAVAAADHVRRIGAWVRDSTKGIGTLTFFDPGTNRFGALGHGIMDVDTKLLMSVKNGIIMPSAVSSVKRGLRGAPGELEGVVETNKMLGTVTANNEAGIFGTLETDFARRFSAEPMPAATRAQIKTGPATILTNAIGDEVREYDINIESVNRFVTDETKSMVIRITDPVLLEVTGGIVQGMSGSPILQDGRIVGAITHVFVQDPAKGYGIFIEYMLQASLRSYHAAYY